MRKRKLFLVLALGVVTFTSCGVDNSAGVAKTTNVNAAGTWTGNVKLIQTNTGNVEKELTYAIEQSGTTITGGWGIKSDTTGLEGNITSGTINGNDITATLTTTSSDSGCSSFSVTMTAEVIGSELKTTASGRVCDDATAGTANYMNYSEGILTLDQGT